MKSWLAIATDADAELLSDASQSARTAVLSTGAVLVLIASKILVLDKLPGISGTVDGGVRVVERVLCALQVLNFGTFVLYALSDFHRNRVRQASSHRERVQREVELDMLFLEAREQVRMAEARHQAENSKEDAVAIAALNARLFLIDGSLTTLKEMGERGSRFSKHASDRRILEAQAEELRTQLRDVSMQAKRSTLVLTPREKELQRVIEAKEQQTQAMLQLKNSWSALLSPYLKLALDIGAPLVIGVGSLFFWFFSS